MHCMLKLDKDSLQLTIAVGGIVDSELVYISSRVQIFSGERQRECDTDHHHSDDQVQSSSW